MMAIASVASLWTEEFLEEVATALEVSLGRVTANDLIPSLRRTGSKRNNGYAQ